RLHPQSIWPVSRETSMICEYCSPRFAVVHRCSPRITVANFVKTGRVLICSHGGPSILPVSAGCELSAMLPSGGEGEAMATQADERRWREAMEGLGAETVRAKLAQAGADTGTGVLQIVGNPPHPTRKFIEAWLAEQDAAERKRRDRMSGW